MRFDIFLFTIRKAFKGMSIFEAHRETFLMLVRNIIIKGLIWFNGNYTNVRKIGL